MGAGTGSVCLGDGSQGYGMTQVRPPAPRWWYCSRPVEVVCVQCRNVHPSLQAEMPNGRAMPFYFVPRVCTHCASAALYVISAGEEVTPSQDWPEVSRSFLVPSRGGAWSGVKMYPYIYRVPGSPLDQEFFPRITDSREKRVGQRAWIPFMCPKCGRNQMVLLQAGAPRVGLGTICVACYKSLYDLIIPTDRPQGSTLTPPPGDLVKLSVRMSSSQIRFRCPICGWATVWAMLGRSGMINLVPVCQQCRSTGMDLEIFPSEWSVSSRAEPEYQQVTRALTLGPVGQG